MAVLDHDPPKLPTQVLLGTARYYPPDSTYNGIEGTLGQDDAKRAGVEQMTEQGNDRTHNARVSSDTGGSSDPA